MMTSLKTAPAMRKYGVRLLSLIIPVLLATSCAQVNAPNGRSVNVPTVTPPLERPKTINDRRSAVTRVKLGRDVLVPQALEEDPMPDDVVGPYELRGETLASTLQLILDDYDVSLAFESDRAMTERITVANLRGKLGSVVDKVCGLANLYCHYEDGTLIVKETETFIVDLPPLAESGTSSSSSGSSSDSGSSSSSSSSSSSDSSSDSSSGGSSDASYDDISEGLAAIIGTEPTVDATTRVMIYTANQRGHKYAERYFEKLRKNTALIIYETHIWEVALNNSNRTGIDWSALFNNVGNFNLEVALPGGAPTATGGAAPISITPTYTGTGDVSSEMVLEFIAEHGTVKTVSQPQLTVLSGSSASMTVEQSENFVSGVTRTRSTTVGVPDSVSTTTETVQTGLAMNVSSAWDQSTVYGTIGIELNELLDIDEFQPDADTTIQLPKTTARTISTQIRVRPGDAVLIAGLVTEKDDYSASGPGFLEPLLQTARSASTRNTELVFLLRPRVIAFDMGTDADTVEMTEAYKEQQKPNNYSPRNITGDVGAIFDTAPAGHVPAPLPESISPEAMSPAPAKVVVVPEAPAAPAAVLDDTAPVTLLPKKSDAVEANDLPTWLPSQKRTNATQNDGVTP